MDKSILTSNEADGFDYVYHFQTPTHLAIKLVNTKKLIKRLKRRWDVDMETFNKICDYCNWLRNKSRKFGYEIAYVSDYYRYVQMKNKLDNVDNILDITTPFSELNKIQKVRRYFYYVDSRSHGLMHYHSRTNLPMDEYLYNIIKYDHRLLNLVKLFNEFRQAKSTVELALH